MAGSGLQVSTRGPPPGLAFNLDEWVPCEVYLGCTEERETDTATSADLARVIAKLHRRHERDHGTVLGQSSAATEVYVKVIPLGFILRVIPSSRDNQETNSPQEGIREFFETVRIARCSANHEPCNRALIWVYNRRSLDGGTAGSDGRVECHGVVCRDLRDATRLANTLAAAFYEMRQQPVSIGNAFGAVGGAVSMSGVMQSVPGELPPAYTPAATGGEVAVTEPRSRRARSRGGRQMRVLEVVTMHQGEDIEEGSQLDLSPRSTGSMSPRDVSSPPNAAGTTRNSTVSLHSAVAISEVRSPRGQRYGGMPDVAADPWGNPVG
ncbi:uncharacterized protein LOC119723796 [Patiria miniata]|uniref:PID domain-containing protein n=1 Tax=Patiria miniata TaxID=46514 RepID=A0A913ZFL3_PATMI|nr:uncharacterized protein LOC119723796 [Patiria miniata]